MQGREDAYLNILRAVYLQVYDLQYSQQNKSFSYNISTLYTFTPSSTSSVPRSSFRDEAGIQNEEFHRAFRYHRRAQTMSVLQCSKANK